MSNSNFSVSQINKLGEKLRKFDLTVENIAELSCYRDTFAAPTTQVVTLLALICGVEATPRLAKTTRSIVDKLRREKTRLSKMQDIGGCRITVRGLTEQYLLLGKILELFPDCIVDDKNKVPMHGYRAVHIILNFENRLIEIQIRTEIQHLWATLSEKAAYVFSTDIKYGAGDPLVKEWLARLSNVALELDLMPVHFWLDEQYASDSSLNESLAARDKLKQHYEKFLHDANALLESFRQSKP